MSIFYPAWERFKFCFWLLFSPRKYWQVLYYCLSIATSRQNLKTLYSCVSKFCKAGLVMCGFFYAARCLKGRKYSPNDFRRSLGDLKTEFPTENTDNWIRISAVVTTLLTPQEPRRPGALLLIKPANYHLEEKLADLIDSALHSKINYMELNKDDLLEGNQNSITEIVDRFQTHFSNGGKVVIVRDIDEVQNPDVLNLFHALCDNDYAKNKRVCFLFTVTLSSTLEDMISADDTPEEIRDKIFNEKWNHIPVDRSRPLLARIGASSTLWLS